MRITRQWLIDSTKHGVCNKAQLAIFGIEWPPKSGWMHELIGRDISEETSKEFIEAQHRSIRQKTILPSGKVINLGPSPFDKRWKFCPHCGEEL